MPQLPPIRPPQGSAPGGPVPNLPLPPPPPGATLVALPGMPQNAVFDGVEAGEEPESDGIEQTKKVSKFVQLTPNFGFQIQRKPFNAILYERELATDDIINPNTREVSTKKGEWTKWKRRGFYPNIIWMCSTVLKDQLFHSVNAGPDNMNIQALMMLIINIDIGMRDAVLTMVEDVLLAVVEDREIFPTGGGRPPAYGTAEHLILKKAGLLARIKGAWTRRMKLPAEITEGATQVKE